MKTEAKIIKRKFSGDNTDAETSLYFKPYKYLVQIDSLYYRNTGHKDYRQFKTKKEALAYILENDLKLVTEFLI